MRKLLPGIVCAMLLGAASIACGSDRTKYYRYMRTQKEHCTRNLSGLYGFLKFYAENNHGKLPAADNGAGLVLLAQHGAAPELFNCEAAKGKKIKKSSDLKAENIPFIYFGNANLFQVLKKCPQMILICDRPDSRHCNVLLADGTTFELNEKIRLLKLKKNYKPATCLEVVEVLYHIYKYPPDVLEVLRQKARRFDKEYGFKIK